MQQVRAAVAIMRELQNMGYILEQLYIIVHAIRIHLGATFFVLVLLTVTFFVVKEVIIGPRQRD
jgi:hypothetical protein